ncbi:MAG: ROK family protein [Tissierellia bacterium]|nr:ROK family protein [Tissierellia bacterium]
MSILSLDVGGSKLLLARFSQGEIVEERQIPTLAHEGREALLKRMVELILSMKEDASSIGLLIPGVIYQNSYVRKCSNLPLNDFDLKAFIEKETGLSAFVGNDVSFALYGEWKKRGGHFNNVVGLFAGSGLGGGLILGGELYSGQGAAGEIGHMNYIPEGRSCGCGGWGCYESYVAKSGMLQRLEEFAQEGGNSILLEGRKSGEMLDSRVLAKGYKLGDSLAVELFEESARALGSAIASLHAVLEPDLFILGGGVVDDYGEEYFDEVNKWAQILVMPSMANTLKIETSMLKGKAGIYGGYYFAKGK